MGERSWERRRQRLLAAGLCTGCGKNPPKLTSERCTRCMLDHQETKEIRHEERVKKGRCPRCGKGRREPDRWACAKCLHACSVLSWRWQKQQAAAGRCVRCGDTAVPGSPRCDGCRRKHRRETKERAMRNARAGLCRCGRARDDPALKVCRHCRAVVNDRFRRRRQEAKAAQNVNNQCPGTGYEKEKGS